MKEKIKEIAEKAYRLTVLASHSELHKCVIGSDYFNVLEKEKFAELIIRECLEIIDEEGSHEGGSIRSMEKIKENFGVEV